MRFNWNYSFQALPYIAGKLNVALTLTIIGTAFSLVTGVVFAVISYYKVRGVSQVLKIWTSFVHGTPVVTRLFFFYYGLASLSSLILSMSPTVAVAVIMSLNTGAFVSESVRGALISVDKGQRKIAMAFDTAGFQMTIRIVIPQAIRVALPSLFSDLVNPFKISSLTFLVGVRDVMGAAKIEGINAFQFFEYYAYVMLIYWVITLILTAFQEVLEKRHSAIFQTVCLYIIIFIKWRKHMKNKRATALIISTALAAASTTGCSDQSPEPAASARTTQVNPSGHARTGNSDNDIEPAGSRTVTVGTTGTDEPYSMVDNQGNWTGAEADLQAEIEARTRWTIEMKQVSDIASLFGELNTGHMDVATSCFAIAGARLKTYIAPDPIYADAQIIIVRPDSEYKTLDDLHGHTVGVTAGQAVQSTAGNMAPDYDWKIVTYEDSNAGFQGCSLGHINCYANTVTNIEKTERTQNLKFRVLDQKLLGNSVGWWFANTEKGAGLRDDINVVLKEVHENGTISEIVAKWFCEDLSQLVNGEWLAATH